MSDNMFFELDGSAVTLVAVMDTLCSARDFCEAIRLASYGIQDQELTDAFHALAEEAKSHILTAHRMVQAVHEQDRAVG